MSVYVGPFYFSRNSSAPHRRTGVCRDGRLSVGLESGNGARPPVLRRVERRLVLAIGYRRYRAGLRRKP